MRQPNARDAALQVLTACRTRGAWADAALKAQLAKQPLNAADAALCSRLVYGVMQNRMLLDHRLAAFCSQKLERLQPPLADILRIGAYQILFLDRIPDSAAVNESVELSKRVGRGAAAGLVNAVLRRLSHEKSALAPVEGEEADRLSTSYSHPKGLVERLLTLLGSSETEQFLRCDNEAVPMTVQVNPLKTSQDELIAELAQSGVTAEKHCWVPDCLILGSTGDVTLLPAFRAGKFLVQDPAARLAAAAASLCAGARVLDVCAAPGGKSFAAAFAMRDQGSILACDLHENKLVRIREGRDRLGIRCIETAAADAREFHSQWQSSFDAVFCDVPCSGLGIIRKKPDIRYKDPAELSTLPAIQRAILDNSARYVKPGGMLVYSTCTILPEENEMITDAFLSTHPDFTYEEFMLPQPVGAVQGRITLWPQRHDTDGFFICRMRRRGHD